MDDENRRLLIQYLNYHWGTQIKNSNDLLSIPTKTLLGRLNALESEIIPFIFQWIKESEHSGQIFEKLMGDHDPDLQEQSNQIFERYQTQMLDSLDEEINPLLVYLRKDFWHDLGFLQSRESFFLRQSWENIEEFLRYYFKEIPDFGPAGERVAWNWFFNQVLMAE